MGLFLTSDESVDVVIIIIIIQIINTIFQIEAKHKNYWQVFEEKCLKLYWKVSKLSKKLDFLFSINQRGEGVVVIKTITVSFTIFFKHHISLNVEVSFQRKEKKNLSQTNKNLHIFTFIRSRLFIGIHKNEFSARIKYTYKKRNIRRY